ncbi:MAG: hypothetical protein KGL99_02225 [Burkholderiales bacterium]|nr:hypothetical protein [Burkholderiales bacterium]
MPNADADTPARPIPRRRLLAAASLSTVLPLLASGCASPLPGIAGDGTASDGDAAARRVFDAACAAHGLAAWRRIHDLNLTFEGEWRALVPRLQPELVDAGFRGRSEERVLPGAGLVAQLHTGPAGHKQVIRRRGAIGANRATGTGSATGVGDVAVAYNGQPSTVEAARDAAALVVDGYLLFLLGPLALADREAAGQTLAMRLDEPEAVDGRLCDALAVRLAPGLGFAAVDQLILFIDREERLMRRVRFSLEGLASTQGAVAEVDVWEHRRAHGVMWPTRFHERLRRPIPGLPVHDWRLVGLDIDRGYEAADFSGPGAFTPDGRNFTGRAARPAEPWPDARTPRP